MSEKVYTRNSSGNVASLVAASNPALLCGISGYNAKATDQFIQIHDAASLPADASVPVIVFEVTALTKFSIDYTSNPRPFSTGIIVCNSSTEATKTIGSADCQIDVTMKAKVR